MANVSGARTSINVNTNVHRRQVSPNKVFLKHPDVAPFIRFFSALKTLSVIRGRKLEWIEDDYVANTTTVTTQATSSATTLVVTDYTLFVKYDIVRVEETGENFRVTATPSSTSVSIARAVGGTSAATIEVGHTVRRIGSAYTEDTALQAANSTQKSIPYNQDQDFRKAVNMSKHQKSAEEYGGRDLPFQLKKKLTELMTEADNACIFGSRGVVTSTSQYTLGGMDEIITTNTLDVSGAGGLLTQGTFEDFVATCFDTSPNSSGRKIVFCGANMLKAVNSWGWEFQQVNPGAKSIGLMVREYISPFGKLGFVHHKRTLRGDTYGGYAYILDPENIGIAYHADFGRPHLVDHTKSDTKDSNAGALYEYTMDFSLMRAFEDSHGKITGILG